MSNGKNDPNTLAIALLVNSIQQLEKEQISIIRAINVILETIDITQKMHAEMLIRLTTLEVALGLTELPKEK